MQDVVEIVKQIVHQLMREHGIQKDVISIIHDKGIIGLISFSSHSNLFKCQNNFQSYVKVAVRYIN
jgi:hypothetical protein